MCNIAVKQHFPWIPWSLINFLDGRLCKTWWMMLDIIGRTNFVFSRVRISWVPGGERFFVQSQMFKSETDSFGSVGQVQCFENPGTSAFVDFVLLFESGRLKGQAAPLSSFCPTAAAKPESTVQRVQREGELDAVIFCSKFKNPDQIRKVQNGNKPCVFF